MTNLATTPPTLVAYAGLQKRGAYLRDNTVCVCEIAVVCMCDDVTSAQIITFILLKISSVSMYIVI